MDKEQMTNFTFNITTQTYISERLNTDGSCNPPLLNAITFGNHLRAWVVFLCNLNEFKLEKETPLQLFFLLSQVFIKPSTLSTMSLTPQDKPAPPPVKMKCLHA